MRFIFYSNDKKHKYGSGNIFYSGVLPTLSHILAKSFHIKSSEASLRWLAMVLQTSNR